MSLKNKHGFKLEPKCHRNINPKAEVLNATGILKPCENYSSRNSWIEFVNWAKENGCDAHLDLDTKTKTIDEVKKSKTWQLLQNGFKNGNLPKNCFKMCSSNDRTLSKHYYHLLKK